MNTCLQLLSTGKHVSQNAHMPAVCDDGMATLLIKPAKEALHVQGGMVMHDRKVFFCEVGACQHIGKLPSVVQRALVRFCNACTSGPNTSAAELLMLLDQVLGCLPSPWFACFSPARFCMIGQRSWHIYPA